MSNVKSIEKRHEDFGSLGPRMLLINKDSEHIWIGPVQICIQGASGKTDPQKSHCKWYLEWSIRIVKNKCFLHL